MVWDILAYLSDHPDAQDSLEGIAEWWLMTQRIQNSIRLTRHALTELATQGLVLTRQQGDGRTLYRVNRAKLRIIRTLLKRHQPAPLISPFDVV